MTPGLQQILADGGDQVLDFTPGEKADASPAPTWSLEDLSQDPDNTERVLASGSATVDPASAPIGAEVSPTSIAPRTLEVPGDDYVEGRAYQLEALTTGEAQRVYIARAGITEVELTGPVRGTFPSGSLLEGLTLSATIPSSVAADEDMVDEERPLELVWTFYVRGRLRRVTELARVVRGQGLARYEAKVQDELEAVWSELAAQLERRTHTLPRIIRHCERKIHVRLRGGNEDPEQFMTGPHGFDLLMTRVLLHFADLGMYPKTRDPEEFRRERKEEYVQMWNDVMLGTAGRDAVRKDGDNVATESHSRKVRFAVDLA